MRRPPELEPEAELPRPPRLAWPPREAIRRRSSADIAANPRRPEEEEEPELEPLRPESPPRLWPRDEEPEPLPEREPEPEERELEPELPRPPRLLPPLPPPGLRRVLG